MVQLIRICYYDVTIIGKNETTSLQICKQCPQCQKCNAQVVKCYIRIPECIQNILIVK